MTLGELATLVGGQLHGEAAIGIRGADIVRDAKPGEITLADGPQVESDLAKCPAAAVVVPEGFEPAEIAFISVDDVHSSFAKIVTQFHPSHSQEFRGISPSAAVSDSATVGDGAVVHPGATIADGVSIGAGTVIHSGVHLLTGCQIGKQVTIFPGAVLYENTVVGDRVLIHAAAVIGSHGFGYRTIDGCHRPTAQLGFVRIDDDVEIGAGTTIDRGTYRATTIGKGTKIDNQVHIAHNCRIGRHNLICAQVGIAGSCTTGDYVVMAGQVGLRDHIEIGNQAVLGAKSGVIQSVPAGQTYVGIPATPAREQKVKQVAWAKLPELRKELKVLIKRVTALEMTNDQ